VAGHSHHDIAGFVSRTSPLPIPIGIGDFGSTAATRLGLCLLCIPAHTHTGILPCRLDIEDADSTTETIRPSD